MDVKREIGGVAVSGRLDRVGALQRLQLLKPYGQLSVSFQVDSRQLDGIDTRAAELLNQLYDIASYAHDNRLMLKDILGRVLRRIEAQNEIAPGSAAKVAHQEIKRFFTTAFPMSVPEECWEQVLRMIARAWQPG